MSEEVPFDANGDGVTDYHVSDTDGDGYHETIYYDTTGDGTADTIGVDTSLNGQVDVTITGNGQGGILVAHDQNDDGYFETRGVDYTSDGRLDRVDFDLDGDRVFERSEYQPGANIPADSGDRGVMFLNQGPSAGPNPGAPLYASQEDLNRANQAAIDMGNVDDGDDY